MPPEAARRLLGPEAIIGFSTHNLDQARLATKMPVDYIALGPIFATSTKETSDAAVGLARIATGARRQLAQFHWSPLAASPSPTARKSVAPAPMQSP